MRIIIPLLILLVSCSKPDTPKHKDSVQFSLSGGISSQAAQVSAKFHPSFHGQKIRAILFEDTSSNEVLKRTSWQTIDSSKKDVYKFHFHDLAVQTSYFYGFEAEGKPIIEYQGSFSTFPPENQSADFKVAFSCGNKFYEGQTAAEVANDTIFEVISGQNPLFFIHTGDFHYGDININDKEMFKQAFEGRLKGRQAELYRNTPLVYIWDDHDYGDNNSSRYSDSKQAVHQVYREYFPHYELAGKDTTPIYQSFTVGRVRFIATDLRTESDPSGADNPRLPEKNIQHLQENDGEYYIPDNPKKTQMGAKQKQWFKKELLKARDEYGLIVWISSRPWIGTGGNDDRWWGYSYERREIARFIKENKIDNLCMIAGDMHGVGIDDGRHNGYYLDNTSNGMFEVDTASGFPVFQAAALTSGGSVKGGPFSHGVNPGKQQYGVMKIEDDGQVIKVIWEARNVDGIIEADGRKITYAFSR